MFDLRRTVLRGYFLALCLLALPPVAWAGEDDVQDMISVQNREDRKQKLRSWFEKRRYGSVTLISEIPSYYLTRSPTDTATVKAKIVIDAGVITKLAVLKTGEETRLALQEPKAVQLDGVVLYPGLINLHNHTKQDMLPVWGYAKGQFSNRFEWRDWPIYQSSVSANMNPWVGLGSPVDCAAFRWAEISNMVLGTIYLQGPSSCVDNFAIHQVEDAGAYKYSPLKKPKAAVQAPTDLVIPEDFSFVWNDVGRRIIGLAQRQGLEKNATAPEKMDAATYRKALLAAVDAGITYEIGLKAALSEYCPRAFAAAGKNEKSFDPNGAAEMKFLGNQEKLKASCDLTRPDFPKKLIRYVYWDHKTIAGKKNYFAKNKGRSAALITHLAEGRRLDPYNRLEFDLVRVLGFTHLAKIDGEYPHINFVHAVGVDAEGLRIMGERGMGLIWSPFSNFLLYGETANIKAAKLAGVTIGMGSDWTPTGSKSVLEELKIARNYLLQDPFSEGLAEAYPKASVDFELFRMVTENNAKLINHLETKSGDGEHGIGVIAEDAMGSLIAVAKNDPNAFTNLVTAEAKDIGLVLVDGIAQYGDEPLVRAVNKVATTNAAHIAQDQLEVLAFPMAPINQTYSKNPLLELSDAKSKLIAEYREELTGAYLKRELNERIVDFLKDTNVILSEAEARTVDSRKREHARGVVMAAAKKAAAERAAKDAPVIILGDATVAALPREQFGSEGNTDHCGFKHPKVFVDQDTSVDALTIFYARTDLNLDRAGDIARLLGFAMLNHTRNLGVDPKVKRNEKFTVKEMPSLFSCQDSADGQYLARFNEFVSMREPKDNQANRGTKRTESNLTGKHPKGMAAAYGLVHEQDDY